MKHYFHPMSRGVTTHWMLTELDASYEPVVIDFPNGENREPAYIAVNPMGKVPALEDEGNIVTETAAICAYLADKYPDKGMAPSTGTPERAKYYRYLFFPGTTLEPMFTVAQADISGISPESAGFGDMERCLNTIEVMTPDEGWAMGEAFTAADVVYGGTLDFAVRFGWLPDPSEKIARYIKRLQARPAYRETHPADWYE